MILITRPQAKSKEQRNGGAILTRTGDLYDVNVAL